MLPRSASSAPPSRNSGEPALSSEIFRCRGGLALISYCAGDFPAARSYAERALQACGPGRDEKARQISGEDTGTVAMCALAVTAWQTGEIARAREWIEAAKLRATEIDHGASKSMPLSWRCSLEILAVTPSRRCPRRRPWPRTRCNID